MWSRALQLQGCEGEDFMPREFRSEQPSRPSHIVAISDCGFITIVLGPACAFAFGTAKGMFPTGTIHKLWLFELRSQICESDSLTKKLASGEITAYHRTAFKPFITHSTPCCRPIPDKKTCNSHTSLQHSSIHDTGQTHPVASH